MARLVYCSPRQITGTRRKIMDVRATQDILRAQQRTLTYRAGNRLEILARIEHNVGGFRAAPGTPERGAYRSCGHVTPPEPHWERTAIGEPYAPVILVPQVTFAGGRRAAQARISTYHSGPMCVPSQGETEKNGFFGPASAPHRDTPHVTFVHHWECVQW